MARSRLFSRCGPLFTVALLATVMTAGASCGSSGSGPSAFDGGFPEATTRTDGHHREVGTLPSPDTGSLTRRDAGHLRGPADATSPKPVSLSQNGATSAEQGQVATTVAQLTAGGGVGGVGGEGLGPPVTDGATLAALKSPSSDGKAEGLTFLYPYDQTVWPRGLLAPLLQWSWMTGDADAVLVQLSTTSGSFTWDGTFGRPAILSQTQTPFNRLPIPQDVWAAATEAAGGVTASGAVDQLVVKLTVARSGEGYGPIQETWTVAPGLVNGTVYYQSYGTKLATSSWGVGAATLAIRHGATAPVVITSDTVCSVCHSVSADGSRLVTELPLNEAPGVGADFDLLYALKQQPPASASLPETSGLYTWPAVSPDATLLFSNSAPMGAGGLEGAIDAPSALFALPSGSAVTATGLPSGLGAALPVFSPDGKHIAFNFFQGGPGVDGKSADNKSLAVIDFDESTKTFSNLRTVYTPTPSASCPSCTAVWSSFTPRSDAIIFELETVNNGYSFAGECSPSHYNTMLYPWDPDTTTGAHGELWWVDLASMKAHRLDALNGLGYLPTGPNNHGDDTALDFQPTVAPVVIGGYVWVSFMSRRLYGNVATQNPWYSDTQMMTFTQPMTKKVWVAAIDLDAKPGTDPSHPAFYLPAQELLAGNARAFWVLDPCEQLGGSCQSGDQCCSGYCEPGDGGTVCANMPASCAAVGNRCASASDCCDATNQCVDGYCAETIPPPPK